jgi:hypothetical protein
VLRRHAVGRALHHLRGLRPDAAAVRKKVGQVRAVVARKVPEQSFNFEFTKREWLKGYLYNATYIGEI